MPDFASRADGTVPPAGDSALDELLTAAQSPQDAAAGLQPVAEVLAALRAGPADGELTGQARALAEFRSTVRVSHRAGRRRARPVPFRERLGSKLATITAATAVAVGGTVAAGYFGALPGPIQRTARDVIASHGRPAPATFGARRLHTRPAAPRPLPAGSAAVSPSPATSPPSWRHAQPGSARKHYQHKRHGQRKDHWGRWPGHPGGLPGEWHGDGPAGRRDNPMARYQGNRPGEGPAARRYDNPVTRHPGNRYGDGQAGRRNDNPMAHHKGSRLRSPLPRAAAFPSPPAGPDRPGAGGR
jgi:hypothetical protein